MKYDHLKKKQLGLNQLQIISECYMYFLQFSKIMKIKKNVNDKNTKCGENVYIINHVSCESRDILKMSLL